jgi:hypothetical protein
MAVASNIEVNDVGTGRSLDELEENRREDSEVLDRVRGRVSRRADRVCESRFGGITTGIVLIDPRVSMGVGRWRPEQSSEVNDFIPD